MPPQDHAQLSPSAAVRWLQCPVSVALADQAGPEEASPHAMEGTAAHALAEIEARYELIDLNEAAHKAALAKWDTEFGSQYDKAEMLRHVGKYVDQVRAALDGLPHSVLLLEQRMDTGIPGVWGTGDAVVVSPEAIHVLDLKYGRGVPVDAARNPQLRLYGLGALRCFGDLLGDVETVSMSIIQPRLGSFSTETLPVRELEAWREGVVMPAVERIAQGSMVASPSEGACRWCPVAGECRARRDYLTSQDFSEPPLLDDAELATEVARIAQLRSWCDAVEKCAFKRVYEDGRDLPGLKVVRGRGRRVITDQPAAIQTLIDHGYGAEQVADFKVKPLGQLEKLVGKKDLPGIIGTYMERREGPLSLVGEDDPRPSVTRESSAVEDFG